MTDQAPIQHEQELCAIVACDRRWLIGRDGGLPWSLPDDLRWFKQVTGSSPIIMGRATHASIGRALHGRVNIVLTRDDDAQLADGVIRAGNINTALKHARAAGAPRAFVIGGDSLYRRMLPCVSTLYLTVVDGTHEGDTFMPALNMAAWRVIGEVKHGKDKHHAHSFRCLTLARDVDRPALNRWSYAAKVPW